MQTSQGLKKTSLSHCYELVWLLQSRATQHSYSSFHTQSCTACCISIHWTIQRLAWALDHLVMCYSRIGHLQITLKLTLRPSQDSNTGSGPCQSLEPHRISINVSQALGRIGQEWQNEWSRHNTEGESQINKAYLSRSGQKCNKVLPSVTKSHEKS